MYKFALLFSVFFLGNTTVIFSQNRSTNCLDYINSIPLNRTTGLGKETIKSGIYQAVAQRYNSFTGVISAVTFWGRVNPGGGDSNRVKVIIYQLGGFDRPGVILAQTVATVYLDSALKPEQVFAFFNPPYSVSNNSIIISVEPYYSSTDDFYVRRNIQGDGNAEQLSLVKQANVWYPKLISNLGPEYDIDFLILPMKSSTLVSNFSYTNNNGNVTFTNSSTGGYVYKWNFGDGTTSTLINPVHTYSDSGIYNVCLYQYGSDTTCFDSIVKPVNVTILPCNNNAMFNFNADTTGKVTFTDASTGNYLNQYKWTFGDGQTSILKQPTHNYLISGDYLVSLTVYSSDSSCSSVLYDTVSVFICNLIANFNFTIDSLTGSATFSNLSSGNILYYYWNFGDTSTSTLISPVHVYSSTGNNIVSLTIYSKDSLCRSSFVDTLVYDKPVAINNNSFSNLEFSIQHSINNKIFKITFENENKNNFWVYDIQGRVIQQEILSSKENIINLGNCTNGLYFLKINNQVFKIVITP